MAVGTTAFPTALDTAVELVELTNNASSTLTSGISAGDTTITVDDPAEFPTTGFGTLVDDLTTPTTIEIISWTGKSGSDLTGVTRGAQGTSAAAFSAGEFIEVRPTKGHHEALRGAMIAVETKLGSGSSTASSGTVLRGTGAGTSAWGAITNAYIDAAAAIALSKLATVTASRALVSDASGFVSASSVTATEAGYLSGVTSAIQTQLDGKQAAFGSQTANTVYAGPTTGAAAAPAFRALVSADIPDISATYLTVASAGSTYQPLDATLTALAAYNTNGLLTQTASDTFTGRTITGTADKIDVTNGDGVSGNPTLTISATYAGQTSIVTLGTVTTGTWNGTAIAAQYGGTGLNTSASTGYPSLSTGTWSVVSATTLTAALNAMVGDSGSGGTKGLVPAPAAGDAAADKFLKADGTWSTAGGGGLTVSTTTIASGTAGRILYETSGNVLGEIAGSAVDANGAIILDAADRTSGVASYFTIKTPADTGQTASTESVGIYFGGNGSGSTVTRTWATGALTTQRENVFVAPTYAFAGASTITTAATVTITGPPIAGANATISTGQALWLQAGPMYIGPSGVNVPSLVIEGSAGTTGIRVNGLAVGDSSGSSLQIRTSVGTLEMFTQNYPFRLSTQNSYINFGGSGYDSYVGVGGAEAFGTPLARLHVKADGASVVGFRVDSSASPTAPIARLTNNGTVGYEFWGGYWQVQKEAATDPTATQLTDGDHFSIYRKNDKFVIAYNNGGTITYLTIPLDGSTNTWTQSTTAP